MIGLIALGIAALGAASTATAVGSAVAVTTVTAVALAKYADSVEEKNSAEVARVRKYSASRIADTKEKVSGNVKNHNSDACKVLLQNLESCDLSEEDKQVCRLYAASKLTGMLPDKER